MATSIRTRRWIPVLVLGLCLPLTAQQNLDDEVQRLREQNAEQQAQIDELRAEMARLRGQGFSDQAVEQVREDILDLAVERKVEEVLRTSELSEEAVRLHMPAWLDGLKFKGDMRMRYEGQFFEDERWPEDRNRARFRLRFGLDKTWGDEPDWKVSFRLASGGSTPTSTNQTFDEFFDKKPIWIDRAYVSWTPHHEWLDGLEITIGKMPMPFLTTWSEWDTDVNPEGFFEKYTAPWFGDFKPYGNFGQFMVNEHNRTPDDMTLLVYGGGFDWKFLDDEEGNTMTYSMAVNFWDFTHVKDNTPPSLAGNIFHEDDVRSFLAAEDFDILDFEWKLKGKLWTIPFQVYGNYALNVGLDEDANYPDYDDQGMVGLLLGQNKKKNDFSIGADWFYREPNSGVGYWMDATSGGAGDRGGRLRGKYNLTDFATLGSALYLIDEFVADDDADYRTILQMDLELKF